MPPAKRIPKKPPVLAVDYGHVSAKCLLFPKDSPPKFFEIPFGFSALPSQATVFDNFLQVIRRVEELSGVLIIEDVSPRHSELACPPKLQRRWDPESRPSKLSKSSRSRNEFGMTGNYSLKLPIFVSGELASLQFKKILAHRPVDPVEALKKLNLPLIDVRDSYTFVCGFTHREKVPTADVSQWLPFETDPNELENYLENKTLYNQLVPATLRDLYIEQALAREKISQASDLRKTAFARELEVSEVVLTGAVFAKAPRLEQMVAIVLDGLEPQKPLRMVLDREQWLPAIGTLSFYSEDLAKDLLVKYPMTRLGTAVPVSSPAKVLIDTGLGEPQELLVEKEELVVFPLESGSDAGVTVERKREKKEAYSVSGGEVGLIIDSRPRPLTLPKDNMERRRLLKEWGREMNLGGEIGEI